MPVARLFDVDRAGSKRMRSPLVLICAAVLTAAGCAATPEEKAESPIPAAPAATGPYKIGPQDVLDISVFNLPELNRTVQVSDRGSINFPLVGDLTAAGKTAREIEADLAARLNARYVRSPQVTVFVKEFNSQHVTVDGAVKKPGVFPLRDRNSLMQAIALAGGLDTDLSSSSVVVFRQGSNGTTTLHYDIDAVRAGRIDDPPVQNGDSIIVASSDGKVMMNNIGKVAPALGLIRVVP
jgi:polysaccharide export outer membrane protein